MIEGLQPYSEYRNPSLPWLDEIPRHWEMIPNRALMKDQRQVVGERASDYTLLSLTLQGVIARDMENPKGKFPAQFNTYKVVRPNDIVFCLFDIDETPRGVGLSKRAGMITGAYDVFSPTSRVDVAFLYHYYRFIDDGKLMKPLYTGLRKTIQRGTFASLKTPVPPPDEQAAIVRFLEHANRKIDGFIRAKRKLIGLLNEQKQAIIHRAVTRGLDPHAPLKPSGIPWLGDIPQHWEVRRLKNIKKPVPNSFVDGPFGSNLKSIHYVTDGDAYVVESGFITSGAFVQKEFKTITLDHYRTISRSSCQGGDIVIAKIGAYYGRAGILPDLGKPAVVSGNSLKLTVNETISDNRFVHLALLTARVAGALDLIVNVTAQPALSLGAMNELALPLPPKHEQIGIITALGVETKAVVTAIARTEREIALMQEYRTRLTADVVTGKLDVRPAAAHLPDITNNSTPEPATETPDEIETTEVEE